MEQNAYKLEATDKQRIQYDKWDGSKLIILNMKDC